MRTSFLSPVLILLAFLLIFSSCRTNQVARVYHPNGNHLPPGQAKKVYGHQSAKAFAPGQQKKHGGGVYTKGKYYSPDYTGKNGKPAKGGKGKKK